MNFIRVSSSLWERTLVVIAALVLGRLSSWNDNVTVFAFVSVTPKTTPLQQAIFSPSQSLLFMDDWREMTKIRPISTVTAIINRRWGATSSSFLYMAKKAKRGKLISNVDIDGDVVKPPKRSSSKKSSNKNSSSSASVSPLLAEWMESKAQSSTATTTKTTTNFEDDEEEEDDEATVESSTQFVSFNEKRGRRNRKQSSSSAAAASPRLAAQKERDERTTTLVAEFLNRLERPSSAENKQKSTSLEELLQPIQELISLPLATEQGKPQLLCMSSPSSKNDSQKKKNYRLAWVGSDDAISLIGTGLHKVPLARLQEVFCSLSIQQRQPRIELLEVIRILGPFPNVKNVLQGSVVSTNSKNNKTTKKKNPKQQSTTTNDAEDGKSKGMEDTVSDVEWNITWQSMLDGTGKELLAAPGEENIRTASLQILFASPQVVVAWAVDPGKDDSIVMTKELNSSNTNNLLVFVEEEELDIKLEKYRVAG